MRGGQQRVHGGACEPGGARPVQGLSGEDRRGRRGGCPLGQAQSTDTSRGGLDGGAVSTHRPGTPAKTRHVAKQDQEGDVGLEGRAHGRPSSEGLRSHAPWRPGAPCAPTITSALPSHLGLGPARTSAPTRRPPAQPRQQRPVSGPLLSFCRRSAGGRWGLLTPQMLLEESGLEWPWPHPVCCPHTALLEGVLGPEGYLCIWSALWNALP